MVQEARNNAYATIRVLFLSGWTSLEIDQWIFQQIYETSQVLQSTAPFIAAKILPPRTLSAASIYAVRTSGNCDHRPQVLQVLQVLQGPQGPLPNRPHSVSSCSPRVMTWRLSEPSSYHGPSTKDASMTRDLQALAGWLAFSLPKNNPNGTRPHTTTLFTSKHAGRWLVVAQESPSSLHCLSKGQEAVHGACPNQQTTHDGTRLGLGWLSDRRVGFFGWHPSACPHVTWQVLGISSLVCWERTK